MTDIDYDNLPPFPKRIPEKLRAIRERYNLTEPVDAAAIEAFERGDVDLPVSMLVAYAKLAGVPVENLIDDERDLWFGHRVN
jgi:hypothetical protein